MTTDREALIASTTSRLQIITAFLIAGIGLFMAIAWFLVFTDEGFVTMPESVLLSYMAVGLFLLEMAVVFFITSSMVTSSLQRIAEGTWRPYGMQDLPEYLSSDSAALLQIYQTRHIIICALLDGVGFFACIAFLLEGHLPVLGLALAMIMGLMGLFPTRDRIRRWLETHENRLASLRQETRSVK